jgi:hypothetical protein
VEEKFFSMNFVEILDPISASRLKDEAYYSKNKLN